MFNLDQAISKWRAQMLAAGVKALDVLDELEGHLREDIEEQIQSGSTAEQAFEMAVRRIGNPGVIFSEFAKVSGGKWALLGKLKAVFLWPSVPSLSTFTPSARQTLDLARIVAPRLHHNFIGTEHVLLGMLALEDGVLTNLLKRIGLDRDDLRNHVENRIGDFPTSTTPSHLPYTPRVKKALSLAAREAKACHSQTVGPEHIFLGLLLEGDGIAGRVLKNLGVTAETTRAQIPKQTPPL
jgi:ClpA/ClpB-like protein